jgi:type I restriction enzyme S subunit
MTDAFPTLDVSDVQRVKAYPTYKPSAVEWIGNVPEHWEVKRLKYSATINDETLPETTDPNYEISYVDISGVDPVRGITATENIVFENAPSRARRIVQDGDTIVSTVRTYLRAIAAIRKPADNLIVSTGFAVVRPRSVNSRFLSFTLRESGFVDTIVARSVGVSYPAVNASGIGTIPISLPPPNEQLGIANFLGRETDKIDSLITKKQALIEKLKEKRSALISRTVTRGLPPDATRAAGLDPHPSLKTSGLDWLGEVPMQWEVKRIKHVGSIRYGLGEPPEYTVDGLPFVRATDIKRGKIDLTALKRVSPEDVPWSRRPQLQLHEILVVRSGAYTGDSAIVTPEVVGFLAGYDMVLTVTRARPQFVAWVLLSKYMLEGQIYLERMRAAQPHLNAEELGGFVVLVPPRAEQAAISAFLDRETQNIDAMIAKVETVIDRLHESRSALITAAVTGKIDVRGSTHDN